MGEKNRKETISPPKGNGTEKVIRKAEWNSVVERRGTNGTLTIVKHGFPPGVEIWRMMDFI